MRIILISIAILFSTTSFGQDSLWVLKADSIVQLAQEQLGIPYKWATSSPNVSFDCSGFTSYVYSTAEVTCSRSSSAYATLGTEVPLSECRQGDCIVFAGTAPGSRTPGHVGIVISNTEEGIKFIHCSSSKNHFGVVETDYYLSNYPKRFLSVRRLFE
ncbi:MAG: NlpC/P60 family protein [Crocinitomicaceae bacterium]|nr:NlpC/P60 family protein [Crocinitomicaceae bacterium]